MNFIVDGKVFNGIAKYNDIMANIQKTDVYKNQEFRRIYCSYYRLNKNTSIDFQEKYFRYMQDNKKRNNLNYEDVIKELHKITNRIDYSFSSKLLHTINPDMPILDKHLMRLLGFQLKSIGDDKGRIDYYVKVYNTVFKEYRHINDNLLNGNGKIYDAIRELKKNFQAECKDLSTAKIIDSLIFRIKDARAPSILDI